MKKERTKSTKIAPDRGPGAACLPIIEPGRTTSLALRPKKKLAVGRSEENDVVLSSDELVSRRHACIRIGPSNTIEDLGSSNGTRLRGRTIESGRPHRFETGELI